MDNSRFEGLESIRLYYLKEKEFLKIQIETNNLSEKEIKIKAKKMSNYSVKILSINESLKNIQPFLLYSRN